MACRQNALIKISTFLLSVSTRAHHPRARTTRGPRGLLHARAPPGDRVFQIPPKCFCVACSTRAHHPGTASELHSLERIHKPGIREHSKKSGRFNHGMPILTVLAEEYGGEGRKNNLHHRHEHYLTGTRPVGGRGHICWHPVVLIFTYLSHDIYVILPLTISQSRQTRKALPTLCDSDTPCCSSDSGKEGGLPEPHHRLLYLSAALYLCFGPDFIKPDYLHSSNVCPFGNVFRKVVSAIDSGAFQLLYEPYVGNYYCNVEGICFSFTQISVRSTRMT